jgi:hypothetical protein
MEGDVKIALEELTELERIVLRKALDAWSTSYDGNMMGDRNNSAGHERAIARDLALRLT